MKAIANTTPESRKEWARPELKKIDITEITAHNSGIGGDHHGPNSRS